MKLYGHSWHLGGKYNIRNFENQRVLSGTYFQSASSSSGFVDRMNPLAHFGHFIALAYV